MDAAIQLVTVILIFILVLCITYFTTRFVGGFAKNKMVTGNVEVIDSARVAPSKYIALVRIASKYVAVGIGKDEISYICEVPEEDIVRRDSGSEGVYDFKAVIDKAREKMGKK